LKKKNLKSSRKWNKRVTYPVEWRCVLILILILLRHCSNYSTVEEESSTVGSKMCTEKATDSWRCLGGTPASTALRQQQPKPNYRQWL